eukprot:2789863-Pyramimonas_sp.AAC.1
MFSGLRPLNTAGRKYIPPERSTIEHEEGGQRSFWVHVSNCTRAVVVAAVVIIVVVVAVVVVVVVLARDPP